MGSSVNAIIKFLEYDNLIVSEAHSKATCNASRTECKGGFGEYTLYWEGGEFDQVEVRDFWYYDDSDWGKPISFDGGTTWKSRGLRLVKEARPAYRPDAISVRRSSWVMPSHFFQPMLHSIHLVLDFDLALYSWSRDFHPLDCVHAAHT